MKTRDKFPAILCAAAMIFGCDAALFSGGSPGSPGAVRAAEVVVEAPAPAFVEEGSIYNGAIVVAPPAIPDYVFINNGWYYWNPGLSVWVHVNHDANWRPPKEVHVYNHWSDHPQYHRR